MDQGFWRVTAAHLLRNRQADGRRQDLRLPQRWQTATARAPKGLLRLSHWCRERKARKRCCCLPACLTRLPTRGRAAVSRFLPGGGVAGGGAEGLLVEAEEGRAVERGAEVHARFSEVGAVGVAGGFVGLLLGEHEGAGASVERWKT